MDEHFLHKFFNLCHKVNLVRSEIEEQQRYKQAPYIERVKKWYNFRKGNDNAKG